MKRMKLIGLMLLAIFALGAFAAATASAAEEGFLPKQATALALGGVLTLTPEGGASIVCQKLDTGEITVTNDKTGEGTLHWLGCKAAGLFAFKSLGATGSEELLAKVKFLVCLDPTGAAGLIDAMGVEAEIVGKLHVEVPATKTLIIITGAMLGALLTSGKAKLWSMEFLGSKGKQTVTDCKQGTVTKLHTLLSEENESKKPVPASENVEGGLLQFSEEVELEDAGG